MAPSGQRNNGTLTAASEREALAMLDAKGLYPVSIRMARGAQAAAAGGRSGKRVKVRQMATFYAQLADLLRSGVPLLRSLDILERQSTQATLGAIVREVRGKVADGTSLADAMNQYPRAFDELAVSMIRAGQEGGFLEDVLRRIADFTEQQEDLKAKVTGALAYPIFLAIAGLLVLNILVIFFVPQFKPIFDRLEEKGQLPMLTKVVMGVSAFLQNYLLWMIVGLVVTIVLYKRWVRSESGRMTMDRIRLRLPTAGTIFLNLAIARFTRILGTLLHNGIPILQALRIAKDSTGNRVLSQAIEKAAENVTAGNSLAAPLAACKHFPRDIVEMVAVGEESNSLEKVLVEIANGLEKRTTRQLDLFVRLLEPMMLLVMAGVTLFVVAGLLMPIFRMSSAVQ
jgi:general secretion pathway protein F/type IV pilus assembly protein PilC